MLTTIFAFLHQFVLRKLVRAWCVLYFGKGKRVKPTLRSDNIIRCSAVTLARRIRRKEISSVQVVNTFIDRIREINPLLKCVVDERYHEALQDAQEADNLILSGKLAEEDLEKQFPFLGVPISTKDHVAVKGLLFTCGLWYRKDIRADTDSDAIALMRKAGAIPFVLTNVPELCLVFESNNQLHGRTNNPYDTNRIAGGSSGGEGSLISASGCPLGIGTDLGGSIRIPAGFNGIFGHKPSKCIVPTQGTFPQQVDGKFSDMLTFGPMSRFAEDLLPVLRILSDQKANQLRLDDPVDVTKLRIFYQKYDDLGNFPSRVDRDIQTAIERAVRHFQKICKDQAPTETRINNLKDNFEIFANYATELNVAQMVTGGKSLNQVVELFKCMFGWSKHTFHTLCAVGRFQGKTPERVPHLDAKEANLKSEFDLMLGTDGVFLYPIQPTVAMFHSEPILHAKNFEYTTFVNLLGLPSTAVPMGLNREGLPIGLQVVAGQNQDRLCLAVAVELEKVFGGWMEPGI